MVTREEAARRAGRRVLKVTHDVSVRADGCVGCRRRWRSPQVGSLARLYAFALRPGSATPSAAGSWALTMWVKPECAFSDAGLLMERSPGPGRVRAGPAPRARSGRRGRRVVLARRLRACELGRGDAGAGAQEGSAGACWSVGGGRVGGRRGGPRWAGVNLPLARRCWGAQHPGSSWGLVPLDSP